MYSTQQISPSVAPFCGTVKDVLNDVSIESAVGIPFKLKSLLEALKGFYGAFLLCIGIYLLELLHCYCIVVIEQGKAA